MDDGGSLTRRGQTLRLAIGFCVAVLCLIWVFRDVNPMEVAAQLSRLDMRWIAAAILCDIASYVCDGARWKFLISPSARISLLRTTQAVYAGLFINEILPLRAGEFFRAHLLSRWTSQPLTHVIASLLVARAIDAFWLAIAIGCTALLAPLPRNLVSAADLLGVVVLASIGALFFLVMRKRKEMPIVTKSEQPNLRSRVQEVIAGIASGLANIGRTPAIWRAAGYSAGIPILQALAFWLVMQAYGLKQPLITGIVVFLIVHVGTAVPNTPANVGSYQLLTVIGLTLVGVNKTDAAGFSIVVFLVLTFPLWAIGLVALRFSGVPVTRIRSLSALSQQTS